MAAAQRRAKGPVGPHPAEPSRFRQRPGVFVPGSRQRPPALGRPNASTRAMRPVEIEAWAETWPIAGSFAIARGSKREATVVIAAVSDGSTRGRGECVPYARYGETVEGVCGTILGVARDRLARATLAERLPPG